MQIYLVTNLINGKQYVGQTVQTLHNRWKGHTCDAKRYRGPLHLVHALRKYGVANFRMESLCECESREEMDFLEIFCIELLKTKAPFGYNLTDGGDGTKGTPITEEQRRKISHTLIGRKASEETKAKLRLRPCHWVGRKHKSESLDKMRNAHLGKKASYETRLKMSEAQGGWSHGTATGYSKYKCRCELCRQWRHNAHLRTGH